MLQAATINAAQLLRHDKDMGSVTQGKYAGIIAVDGSPLDHISLMKQVSFVMKEGVVYKMNSTPLFWLRTSSFEVPTPGEGFRTVLAMARWRECERAVMNFGAL